MEKIQQDKPYLIAECAYAYEGDVIYLKKSVERIVETGCVDAVKFHILLDKDTYMTPDHSIYEKLKKWILREDEWAEIIKQVYDSGLDVIILADDLGCFGFLKSMENKLAAIEIHACSLNDVTMLEKASEFTIPAILGIGGSSIDEISFAVDYLKERGKNEIILMYGFQNYPTRYEYINFRKMKKIKKEFNLPLGYADHTAWDDENQELITLAGFICGAKIIEKHFVLDKGKKRIDYEAAISAEDFCSLHEKLNSLHKALGDGKLELNKYEQDYGKIGYIKKTIVAARDIEKEDEISMQNIAFKRTNEEGGIMQKDIMNLVGRRAKDTIKKNSLVTFKNTK